jgi:hypothetical protein
MYDDPMQRARAMLAEAPSWQELRRRLDAAGLTQRLGGGAVTALLAEWQRHEAAGLADAALTAELRHWAEGGGYAEHMRGYNAVPPTVLVEEARRRGWFVRPLGSGGAVVNAPDGRPLVIKALLG